MHEQTEKQKTIQYVIIFVILVAVILFLVLSSQPSEQTDTVSTAGITQVVATNTAHATNTALPEFFGVEIEFDYESSIISDEINARSFRNAVPSTWTAISNVDASYRLELEFKSGRSRSCGQYTNYIDRQDVTLTYTAIDLTVKVIDLTTSANRIILTHTIRPTLPTDCPYTYQFDTSQYGVPLDTTEYITPRAWDLDSWLRENVRSLPNMPATSTPRPTQTSTATATPTSSSTPIADNNLIVTGTIVIRDENAEVIGTVDEGKYTLLGFESEKYVILYNGQRGYVSIVTNNAHPESGITVLNSIIIDGLVIIRDADGTEVARETSGEYVLLDVNADYYVIEYEGNQRYVHISSAYATQSSIVRVGDTTPIPDATDEIVSTSTEPVPEIIPTSTPFTENALIISGEVTLFDSNGGQIATISEGQLPLIGMIDDNYIVLYEGTRALVDRASPNARPAQELAPHELVSFNGAVIIREADGTHIAMETSGQYGLIAIERDFYVIDYNGKLAYILTNSTNVTVSSGILSDTSQQATPRPTATSAADVIQSDYFGIEIALDYQQEQFRQEITESRYIRSFRSDWRAIEGIAPRYRVELYFTRGQVMRCDGYTAFLSSETLTLTYQSIDMQVRVIDLAVIGQPEILHENLTTSLPNDCPFSYSFDVSRGEYQDTTAYRVPSTNVLSSWLNENLPSLADMPATTTLSHAAPPTLTSTPRPATPEPDGLTATPRSTQSYTPIDFPILILNNVTIVYDESGNVIGTAASGDYLLADLNTENYIIIFDHELGYIPRDTANIAPAFSQNTIWTIQAAGLVLLRDENANEIARITEGEFQLLLVNGDYFIINYNGGEAYVRITTTNATLAHTTLDSN